MPTKNSDPLGWNRTHTGYACTDRTEVRVKRQETVMFTRKEQVGQSWENKYDETLLAVGPRNGVVYKLMSKEIKEHRDEPKENIASRVAVSGLMTDKDCK